MPDDLPRQILAMQMTMAPTRQVNSETSEVRMIYNVKSGSFAGDGLVGEVVPTAGDWVTVKGSSITMDVRLRLRADDGADIMLSYDKIGPLDERMQSIVRELPEAEQGDHHFSFLPVLQTRAERLKWLQDAKTFAIGVRKGDSVRYYIYHAGA